MHTTRPASPFVEPWQPSQRTIIVTALVVALIASLSTASFVIQRLRYTPESALGNYFEALADRDAARASSYLSADPPSGVDLGSTAYVPPTDLEVDQIVDDRENDGTRIARVRFMVGDTMTTGVVKLRRKDDLDWGLLRGWTITGDPASLRISTSTAVPVRVNGQTVPTDSGESLDLAVFPGRYVVEVADDPILDSDPVTVDVGFDDREAELVPQIKPAVKSTADARIKAYLTGCLTAATRPDHDCPFSSGYSEITRPVWRIDQYPDIELKLTSDGEVAVRTTSEGQATVTGTGYDGLPYTDTDSFTVTGTITADQGKVVFHPE